MSLTRDTVDPTPEDIADTLHSAAIHLLRAFRDKETRQGLSPAQLSALSVLYFAGSMTMSRLAKAEGVKLPTISRMVKDMVIGGLVHRLPAEDDKRAFIVELTAKGRTLFERARTNRLMALTKAIENLTEDSQKTLTDAANLMEMAAKAVREG